MDDQDRDDVSTAHKMLVWGFAIVGAIVVYGALGLFVRWLAS